MNEKGSRKLRKDAIDLMGQRFGKLEVIGHQPMQKRRGMRWICKCDCGKETIAYGGHLRNGSRVSCGCKSQDNAINSLLNNIFSNYKRGARLRNLTFSIDKTLFKELVLKPCVYCDKQPHQTIKTQKKKRIVGLYNGIDRFDPKQGYTNENCVSCCYYCNHAKLNLTFDEWISHLRQIVKKQGI